MNRSAYSWLAFAAAIVIGVGASGCLGPDNPPEEGSTVPFQLGAPISNPAIVAIVRSGEGSDTLLAERFNENVLRLHSMFPDVMADPEQEASIRREIVKQFVLEKLILAKAESEGLAVDSSDIAARLEEYRSSFGDTDSFRAELQHFGQSEADLEDQFRIELTREAISTMVETQTPLPNDEEVEEFRVLMAERLLTQHILFMVDEEMSSAERSALRKRALAVLDSARSGINFGDLARRHSDDIGTARLGGELPWFRRGEMVEGFEEAALTLETRGEITEDLVQTTYGYHIIRLIDRERDEPMPADSARVELHRHRVRKAEREMLSNLQQNAEVSINPDLISGF